ncbi:hypothetical protein REPUB_Repub15cG0081100 [Reevesia pubescens]
MEMDVARQLMQLCQEYTTNIGDKRDVTEKREEKEEETYQSNPRERSKIDHPLEELEEDEHLQPRKRRFKSIDFIYSLTKPLIIQQNAKKMKV